MAHNHKSRTAACYARPGAANVRSWEWRNKFDRGITEPGALVRRGCHELFVRADDLRAVADALHRIADQIEEQGR